MPAFRLSPKEHVVVKSRRLMLVGVLCLSLFGVSQFIGSASAGELPLAGEGITVDSDIVTHTVWSCAGSPYMVVAGILVNAGISLNNIKPFS
jgi:hypothetical protein